MEAFQPALESRQPRMESKKLKVKSKSHSAKGKSLLRSWGSKKLLSFELWFLLSPFDFLPWQTRDADCQRINSLLVYVVQGQSAREPEVYLSWEKYIMILWRRSDGLRW
jgi:hypothetical protein